MLESILMIAVAIVVACALGGLYSLIRSRKEQDGSDIDSAFDEPDTGAQER